MRGINKIFIAGNLGAKPELLTSKNGKAYTSLSVATHKYSKNDDGGWDTHTNWHRVMVWGEQAQRCVDKLTKGAAVLVEGHIANYATMQNDEKQYKNSITAEIVDFVTTH